MPLRVSSIVPNSGHPLALGPFTVLVGANNCGKSQTLRDIRQFVTSGDSSKLKLLNAIAVQVPTEEEARASLLELPHPNPGNVRYLGVSGNLQSRHEFSPHENWLAEQYKGGIASLTAQKQLLQYLGTLWLAYLDAESRFGLAAPTDSYDPRSEAPTNALQTFFAEGRAALDELRLAFKEAFEMDIALDWAGLRRFYLRVGQSFGDIPDERTALDDLLGNEPLLADQGDSFRSFAGVALAMLTFPNRLLLLDEPEAFLHPAQARVLGRWLARQASKRSAQVIVATHSADFLWGIISTNEQASVVRLNRVVCTTTYHAIASATMRDLVSSPLLSSQPVLDALFHRGVVVCEGDPDRSIYQTVAHRLPPQERGEEILFIHSNGKDALKTPIALLRLAGAPVCAIADFDTLNSELVLSGILEALAVSDTRGTILELRSKIDSSLQGRDEKQVISDLIASTKEWLEHEHKDSRSARKALVALARPGSKWDVAKARGTAAFGDEEFARVSELVDALASVGLFIVPSGALESWLALGMAKGHRWNRAALETLHRGDCPTDLHSFISRVVQFLTEPTREVN